MVCTENATKTVIGVVVLKRVLFALLRSIFRLLPIKSPYGDETIWEELIDYHDADCIKNDASNNSSVVACIAVA
jgi:hypothetical protein